MDMAIALIIGFCKVIIGELFYLVTNLQNFKRKVSANMNIYICSLFSHLKASVVNAECFRGNTMIENI